MEVTDFSDRRPSRTHRRRRLVVLAVVLVVAGGAVAGLSLLSDDDPDVPGADVTSTLVPPTAAPAPDLSAEERASYVEQLTGIYEGLLGVSREQAACVAEAIAEADPTGQATDSASPVLTDHLAPCGIDRGAVPG